MEADQMVNDEFLYLMKQPASKWDKTKQIIGWTLYVLFAFIITIFAAMEVGFWGFFIVGAAFIFGPKLWSSIN